MDQSRRLRLPAGPTRSSGTARPLVRPWLSEALQGEEILGTDEVDLLFSKKALRELLDKLS